MLQKKITTLASAMLAGSGAQASIDISGGELLAVFSSAGQGSYYQFVPGVTAATLLNDYLVPGGSGSVGPRISIDIRAATAALGGQIEQYALFAVYDTGNPVQYNYNEFLYVDVGGGFLYTGIATSGLFPSYFGIESNHHIGHALFRLESFLLNWADLGHNIEGSLGDFDSAGDRVRYLTTSPNNLTASLHTLGSAADNVPFTIDPPIVFTPIPATAWLFVSAVGGLFAAQQRSKKRGAV